MKPRGSGDFGLSESDERDWRDYLADFQRDIWAPMFKPYGVSLGDALIIWKLNALNSNVCDVESAIREDDG